MAGRAAVVEKLKSFVDGIGVLIKVVDAPQTIDQASSTMTFAQARVNFYNSAKILHDNITKFTLGVKDADTLDSMAGLADMVEKDCLNIVYTTQTLVVVMKAHKIIARKLFTRVRDALEGTMELGKAMAEKNYEGNNINRLTGVVWESCAALEKFSLDSKAMIIEEIKGHMGTMKDAVDELEEASAGDADGDDEDDLLDDDDDDFGFNQKLSAEDRKIVPGVVLLLKTAGSIGAQGVKLLSAVPAGDVADCCVEAIAATLRWMGQVHDAVAELAILVDELVQAIYPPQNRDFVVESCHKIKAKMLAVTDLLRDSDGRIEAPVAGKLEQTIRMFVDKALGML